MATIGALNQSQIRPDSLLLSSSKTTIETAFYGNNVTKITSLIQAYQLACQSPGTVITDLEVFFLKKLAWKQKPEFYFLIMVK